MAAHLATDERRRIDAVHRFDRVVSSGCDDRLRFAVHDRHPAEGSKRLDDLLFCSVRASRSQLGVLRLRGQSRESRDAHNGVARVPGLELKSAVALDPGRTRELIYPPVTSRSVTLKLAHRELRFDLERPPPLIVRQPDREAASR